VGLQEKKNRKVLAIVGATASGKTPLSLLLAEMLNAEIISADSRQVYRFLDIGTAKPSKEELGRTRHHFINLLNPDEEYNAAMYSVEARSTIEQLLEQGKTPIIVGGSGLYIKSIMDGFFDGPGKDENVRKNLEHELKRDGLQALLRRLQEIDPETHSTIEAGKPRRVIRALEVYEQTGKPISYWKRMQTANATFEVVQIGMDWSREELYRNINARSVSMIERGLMEEAASLLARGYKRDLNSFNTVGYKEAFDLLVGKISRARMVELVQQNTRRYAKRQLTWFRADNRIAWYPMKKFSDLSKVAKAILHDQPFLTSN
jgi:tRNA dimethylallyltransferase